MATQNNHARILGECFRRNAPAHAELIAKSEKELGINFPQTYKDFLMLCNGGEGDVGTEGYIRLSPVEAIAKDWRKAGFAEYAPSYFPLGADGGGEAFVLKLQDNTASYGYMPFIGIEEAAFVEFATDFWEALRKNGAGEEFK